VTVRRLALILATSTFLLMAAGATGSAAVRTSHDRLTLRWGALLGAYVDDTGHWVDDATAEAGVTRLEAKLGRTLDIDQHYYAWTDRFPTGLERWDVQQGRIPLMSWSGAKLSDILSGRFDAMIRDRARDVRALGSPVFLRWGWEMNGNWSAHDGSHNGSDGPKLYVAAWRHIHDLFDAEGASNAVWVWSPNAGDVPAARWNHWTHYYPGNAYVDWVGIDGYNWGTTQPWSRWTSFASLVAPVYRDYAGRKPIMVAETGSAERGGDKAGWLASAARSLKLRFPAVAALVYFDQNKETDWRVDSSASALRSFRVLAADPYFAPRAARLLAQAQPLNDPSGLGPDSGMR
jgi:hypothetical protein